MSVSVSDPDFDRSSIFGQLLLKDALGVRADGEWTRSDANDNCYVSCFNHEWYKPLDIGCDSLIPFGDPSCRRSVPIASSIEVDLRLHAMSEDKSLCYLIYHDKLVEPLSEFWGDGKKTMCGTLKFYSDIGRVHVNFILLKEVVDTSLSLTLSSSDRVEICGSIFAYYGDVVEDDILGHYKTTIFTTKKFVLDGEQVMSTLHRSSLAVLANGHLKIEALLMDVQSVKVPNILGNQDGSIMSIYSASGATIGILTDTPARLHRHAYLELLGTVDQVKIAELLITEAITEKYDASSIPTAMMPLDICQKAMNRPFLKVVVFPLEIDGTNHARIEAESGAWLELDASVPPMDDQTWERTVNIYGTEQQVKNAMDMIDAVPVGPGLPETIFTLKEIDEFFENYYEEVAAEWEEEMKYGLENIREMDFGTSGYGEITVLKYSADAKNEEVEGKKSVEEGEQEERAESGSGLFIFKFVMIDYLIKLVYGLQNCKRFLLVHICVVGMVLDVELNLRKSYTIKQTVGAQTETKLKEKKLRVEDALNAIKASIEKGIVVGGGCPLLRLAVNGDINKKPLNNDEQKLVQGKMFFQVYINENGYKFTPQRFVLFNLYYLINVNNLQAFAKRMLRCRHGYFHVMNNDITEWKMYVIRGSTDSAINSQGNRYTAPANADSIEVIMSQPFDYQKLKLELETTDVEDMLILLRTYS
ncbi:hypothetical protein CTI12_AA074390 [Artemisia annua]|uniref:Uncharacterized protein n=1 Tax=Artemisia annua TaxID=35608 RepID=A0A2U1Q554_ARTAN|nr:hypothetical protein CTI12_AA074390 [Artemisia annua]